MSFLIFLCSVLCFIGVRVGSHCCWSVFAPSSCFAEILDLVDQVSYYLMCSIPLLPIGTAQIHSLLKKMTLSIVDFS